MASNVLDPSKWLDSTGCDEVQWSLKMVGKLVVGSVFLSSTYAFMSLDYAATLPKPGVINHT